MTFLGRTRYLLPLVAALLLGLLGWALFGRRAPGTSPAGTTADWPTYLHDPERSASTTNASQLTPASARRLRMLWTFRTRKAIAASPTVVGGTVFVGSWDGYEYAVDAARGTLEWKTFLGTTPRSACDTPPMGVSSSAAVSNGVLYVGGGDSRWYALNARSCKVLWSVYTGDNSRKGGHYNWSSPLLFHGYAYIGIASAGDCPLVRGELLQVSLSTHRVVRHFDTVARGQLGGTIWTSPTVDADTNTVYAATGNPTHPEEPCTEPHAAAILALDATTLALKGAWRLPPAQQSADGDWGTTPTLMRDVSGHTLVSASAKNGYVYTFDAAHLAAGPVWARSLAPGGDYPELGNGSVSSSAFAAGRLYAAGGTATISGIVYPGSVRALDPSSGKVRWEHGAPGVILPALAYANGLVLDGAGSSVEVLDAATGRRLYRYMTGGPLYGPPSASRGRIFFGSSDGKLYALAPGRARPSNRRPRHASRSVLTKESPRASYRASGQPPYFPVGGSGTVGPYQIEVTNKGSTTWPARGQARVQLGVHYARLRGGYPKSGTPATWLTDQRLTLAEDVPPGRSETLAITSKRPLQPGRYVLEYEMVQNGGHWSRQYLDSVVRVVRFGASYTAAPPATLIQCGTSTYTVTFTNTGSFTWPAHGPNPVFLSIHVAARGGGYPLSLLWVLDQWRYLPRDVPPGRSVTFPVVMVAPAALGKYVLEFQMAQLGVAWFSDYLDKRVTVVASS